MKSMTEEEFSNVIFLDPSMDVLVLCTHRVLIDRNTFIFAIYSVRLVQKPYPLSIGVILIIKSIGI